MRVTLLLLVIGLLISLHGLGQKAPIKFGEVSIEELQLIKYDKDTAASAVVLCDYGQSKMVYNQQKGFAISFQRILRVKILNKNGYSYADQSIRLYSVNSAEERLGSLKAVTYNLENNKIVESKMKNDAVFKEKADENNTYVKFTLPNIREGSVFEVSYDVTSEFLYNFQDWDFQTTIPTVLSEYRVYIPEYFHYEKYMQGYVPVDEQEESQKRATVNITYRDQSNEEFRTGARSMSQTETVDYTEYFYRWATRNVPAFKEEPFMNNYRDYIARLNFELAYTQFPNSPRKDYIGTWEKVNKEFLESESFEGYVNGAGVLKKTVETTATSQDQLENAARLYQYVKDNVEWNGNYRMFASDNPKAVLENKKGNAAEINLLLVNLFRKAGLESYPVLISTRNHGFIRKSYPLVSQFNYVICALIRDGKYVLLDATDRSLPMMILPERCLNNEGLMISEKGPSWVNINPTFKSRTVTSYTLSADADGALKGPVTFVREGFDAQRSRKSYTAKGEKEYVTSVASDRHWEIEKSTFENMTNLSLNPKEVHEATLSEYAQVAGPTIYLNPLIEGRMEENPFKSESRVYPVDFGSPFERICTGKISIPSGYVVEELPATKGFNLPGGGRYSYNIMVNGDIIQFTSQFVISKPLFSQEEYHSLKEFYNQVVSKQSEQIVLKKK